jgi:serine/threonine protein kinase
MDTMIGTHIFNYKITKLIGAGGMAKVYEAIHDKFENRRVAIKILDPVLSANDEIRHRFENEAKIMASLDHPNIVKVLDYTDVSGVLAIVMEYLEGVTLSDFVKKKGPMPAEEAAKLMSNILEAFEYAHKHGVVHRDVKPSNIHLSNTLQPKIMDFGIAKLLTVDENMTRTGTQMGTPTYMSPEQVRDVKDIDKRSDIYSLGVTFYFMLSGAAPYNTATLSTFDIYSKIVHEPLPPISHAMAYHDVIAKATAKSPAERYPDCLAMVRDLQPLGPGANQHPEYDDDEKTLIVTDQTKKPEPLQKDHKKSEPSKQETPKAQTAKPTPKPTPNDELLVPKPERKSLKKFLIVAVVLLVIGGIGYAAWSFGLISERQPRLANCPDSISYAKGVVQGVYLVGKFDSINMEGLKKGILDAQKTDVADMPEPQLMAKYLKNTFKPANWNEKESEALFEAYGRFVYDQESQNGIYELDNSLFYKAVKAVINKQEILLSFNQALEYLNLFDGSEEGMKSFKRQMAEKAYLAGLANNANLKKTPLGAYYEVVTASENFLVRTDKPVFLIYSIKDINNETIANDFGSYYQFDFLMPGFREVVSRMHEGEKVKAYIPSKLAYDFIGLSHYNIEPYTTLVCEIETPER